MFRLCVSVYMNVCGGGGVCHWIIMQNLFLTVGYSHKCVKAAAILATLSSKTPPVQAAGCLRVSETQIN